MLGQGLAVFKSGWRLPNKTQALLTKRAVNPKAQVRGQLRVVAKGGMGVQRQVIGQQIDIVLQQQS